MSMYLDRYESDTDLHFKQLLGEIMEYGTGTWHLRQISLGLNPAVPEFMING